MSEPHSPRLAPLRAHRLVLGAAILFAQTAASTVVAQDRQIQVAPAQGSAEGGAAPDVGVGAPVQETLSGDILLGKWCGDTTNYVFSSTELTVTFHTGGTRVLRIDHIKTGATWLDVHWEGKRPDGGSNNTVFSDFSADRNLMFQDANVGGDKGPRRRFRRC